MNRTMPARLGALVAASAAVFALGSAPAMAAGTGGANQPCGAYCSTYPNGPSNNGNGGGNATGRPEQGSVGKADNKFPPGQAPDGSDGNNGYECDGNNGVAKGNPAHTTCYPGYPGYP